ncbi:MAG TPA: ferritin-like domain-containing protein [Actinophytocola sp.]|uniref:ferritin-like domain-containing protein n=1 Tax=Actinophytocola sp. TaxID=1872138 RepID=UPI002DB93F54|nr:ferritin-like domain-containing protein [Actinophytocola sp.]HEU5475009.1 ferritin-like domain-containing protein [Actinophytocola sp.]
MIQPSSSPSSAAALPAEASDAVQAALGAEHAAVWVYGLVSAFLPAGLDAPVAAGMAAHRARRDATERFLAAAGSTPRPAEPAYLPPDPVTDQASALALLVTAEADTTVAWRAVLERTDSAELRAAALEALTTAAVRAARWRKAAGQSPVTPALPGQP